jgi:hypothetical protein
MSWYVIFFVDDTENEYFKAESDSEAKCMALADNPDNVLEVHRCYNDECLTPAVCIWS